MRTTTQPRRVTRLVALLALPQRPWPMFVSPTAGGAPRPLLRLHRGTFDARANPPRQTFRALGERPVAGDHPVRRPDHCRRSPGAAPDRRRDPRLSARLRLPRARRCGAARRHRAARRRLRARRSSTPTSWRPRCSRRWPAVACETAHPPETAQLAGARAGAGLWAGRAPDQPAAAA